MTCVAASRSRIGLDDATDDLALDELALLAGRLATCCSGKAVDVPPRLYTAGARSTTQVGSLAATRCATV